MSWYRLSALVLLGAAGIAAAVRVTWPPLVLMFTAIGLVGVVFYVLEMFAGGDP